MLRCFLAGRAKLPSLLSVPVSQSHIHTQIGDKLNSAWSVDLNHLKNLCEEKKYVEVLQKVAEMESKYPGHTKMLQFYRGKAGVALLEKQGVLEQLKPYLR